MDKIRFTAFLLVLFSGLALAQGCPGRSALQEDCNRNGVEDSVDIAFGSSSDVNRNGVPDECEALDPREAIHSGIEGHDWPVFGFCRSLQAGE